MSSQHSMAIGETARPRSTTRTPRAQAKQPKFCGARKRSAPFARPKNNGMRMESYEYTGFDCCAGYPLRR